MSLYNSHTAAARSTAHLADDQNPQGIDVNHLAQLITNILENNGNRHHATPATRQTAPQEVPIMEPAVMEPEDWEPLGTVFREEEAPFLEGPLTQLETAFEEVRRRSKGVKPETSKELWNYWKLQSKAKLKDTTDQKRLKDLTFIMEKLLPLIRVIMRCSQEQVPAMEIITTAEACVALAARYIADETCVMWLCAQYSLDPQKHAKNLRDANRIHPGDHGAMVEKAEKIMQNERMEKALSGGRQYSSSQYAASRPSHSQAGGRDKAGKRSSHTHLNSYPHRISRAAGVSEPAAKDA